MEEKKYFRYFGNWYIDDLIGIGIRVYIIYPLLRDRTALELFNEAVAKPNIWMIILVFAIYALAIWALVSLVQRAIAFVKNFGAAWLRLNAHGFFLVDEFTNWEDFVSVDVQRAQGLEFLVIHLKSYDKIYEGKEGHYTTQKGRGFRKMKMDESQFGSPIAFSKRELPKPPKKIATIINDWKKEIG